MELIAGLILFSVAGAWLAARARAAGAALAFGVIGTVLFCTTPLGAGMPALIGGFVEGTAAVGGQLVDGQAEEPEPKPASKGDDAGDGERKAERGRE
jgi:hypothetical protein